jgi:hypothetical protein
VDGTLVEAWKIRYSAIDGRTSRHRTYQVSQQLRKRVEEIFGCTGSFSASC